MTLTEEETHRIRDFITAVRFLLDPDLQLSHDNFDALHELQNWDNRFVEVLQLADDLSRAHPWPPEKSAVEWMARQKRERACDCCDKRPCVCAGPVTATEAYGGGPA